LTELAIDGISCSFVLQRCGRKGKGLSESQGFLPWQMF
jgi:hypothetical protein